MKVRDVLGALAAMVGLGRHEAADPAGAEQADLPGGQGRPRGLSGRYTVHRRKVRAATRLTNVPGVGRIRIVKTLCGRMAYPREAIRVDAIPNPRAELCPKCEGLV